MAYDPTVIATELNQQIAQYTTGPGGYPLVTILTAREQDRLWALQTDADAKIEQRLADLQALRGTVASSGLPYWQKASITSLLDAAYANVSQLLSVVANASDVRSARTDRSRIRALQVLDVVLPSARKMIKAYDLLNLASIYSGEASSLQPQIVNAESLGCDVTAAQADVSGLAAESGAMTYDGRAILGDVSLGTPGAMRAALYPESLGAAASLRAQSDSANARAAIASLHAQGC